MKGKKLLSLITACVMTMGMLVGCGAKDTANDSKDSKKDGKVEITYAFWNKNEEPSIKQIIKEFEEKNPNVKVKTEIIPYKQYLTKLEVGAEGGSAPDVFWMNGPNFIKYAKNGVLMPLEDKIKEDKVDMSKYPESLVKLYTYDKHIYGIPKDWDTVGLFYNKEMFDKAGMKYPNKNWTWSDLEKAAQKLTNKDKGVWGIAAACTDQQGYYNTIFQNGGYVISEDKKQSGFNKPETIEGVKRWVDLINKGYSPKLQQMTETKPEDLFCSEKVAMVYAGSWMTAKFMRTDKIKEHIDVQQLPKMKNKGNVIHGLINAVYAKTKHPKEAWEFAKFLGSKQANENQAKMDSIIPANKDALPAYYDSYKNLNLKVFSDQAEYASEYPVSADTMKWLDLQNEYMTKAWNGEMPVENACKELAEKMNEVLKNEK